MLRQQHTRLVKYLTLILLFLVSSISPPTVHAQGANVIRDGCADILLVFARGSGQNANHEFIDDTLGDNFAKTERESFSFFNWFKDHLNREYPHVTLKPVTIHDFPGKYSPVGYQAVGVGLAQIANSSNAELSVLPGDYRSSMDEGIVETVGYLKDQIANCPDQNIVVGGYSQGAQIMGDALSQLTPAERTKILAAGFFGDPKYVGVERVDPLNLYNTTVVSSPWRRGDALDSDFGMLDGRFPYVPADMARKTVSYCYRSDLVCSGWTGLRGSTAHGEYSYEPMRNTVNELVGWAAPELAAAERARGGFGAGQAAPVGDNKQRDIMFMLNDHDLQSVVWTMRYQLDQYLNPVAQRFSNTAYAARGFGEGEYSATKVPRVDDIQTAFLPYAGYDPNNPSSRSNLGRAFIARYPSGQPYTGSGDLADPHGVAIERGVFDAGWRPGSEKHLVIITDRPVKQEYSYNICNATVRSWMHIPNTDGFSACFSNFGNDIWPKNQHSEVCETIYIALTQDQCKNPLKQPGFTQMINRSLNDAIIAAQAQGVAVDVIVPYKITDPYNQFGVDNMMNTLKNVAASTGGTFVYYDKQTSFDGAMLSDMMYQIFGHTPKQLSLTYKETLDGQTIFKSGAVLAGKTNTPIVLNVLSNNATHHLYKWDFDDNGTWDEQTSGPTTQRTFTDVNQKFLRVAGLNGNNEIVAETRIALQLTAGQAPVVAQPPAMPNVSAVTNADGSITLSWQPGEEGNLILIDPESKLPLLNVDLLAGTATFPTDKTYQLLLIRTANNEAISDAQVIEVAAYVPLPVTPEPTPPILIVKEKIPPAAVVLPAQPEETTQASEEGGEELQQQAPPSVQVAQPVPEAPDVTSLPTNTKPKQDVVVVNAQTSNAPRVAGANITQAYSPQSTLSNSQQAESRDNNLLVLLLMLALVVGGTLAWRKQRQN